MSRSQWCQQFHASSQVMSLFVFVFVIVSVIFYSSLWSYVLEVTSIQNRALKVYSECIFLCHCLHLSFFYQIRSEKDFERYVALQKMINNKMTVLAIEAKSSKYCCWLIHICAFFSGDANFLCHAREKLIQTPSPTVCSPQTLINNIVFYCFSCFAANFYVLLPDPTPTCDVQLPTLPLVRQSSPAHHRLGPLANV